MKSRLLAIYSLFGLMQGLHAGESVATHEVIYEVFSLPINEAAILKRKSTCGSNIYNHLVSGLEQKKVRQEKWAALRMVEGKNITSEEVEEFIYPAEYEYDKFVFSDSAKTTETNDLMFKAPLLPLPITFPAFDTKKVGSTIEAELSVTGEFASLRLSAVHTRHIAHDIYGKGVSKWVMPQFSVQRFGGVIKTKKDNPVLIATLSPPKKIQNKKKKRIWLAFVTINKI